MDSDGNILPDRFDQFVQDLSDAQSVVITPGLREAVQEVFANEAADATRGALAKLNRQANETGPGFGTVLAQQQRNSESDGVPIGDLFWNQQKVWWGGAICTPDPLRPRQRRGSGYHPENKHYPF
jgi:hypothetical protein